jgi:hypothetical protein
VAAPVIAREKDGMKPVFATIVGLVLATFATTASAHVVEILTSIPAVQAADDADLKEAVASAVDDAVNHAIGFTPTLVSLQNARRVGDRIFIVLLIADHDGEEMMKQLAADNTNSSAESLPDPGADEESL